MENVEELITKLAKETEWVKPATHPFRLSLEWMGMATIYLIATLMISGLRPDLFNKLHATWFSAEILSLISILVSSALSAALLAYPDLHQKRLIALAPLVAITLFLLVMFLSWKADIPPSPLPIHSYQCTLNIALFSLLPAAWTFYMIGKCACTHNKWAGGVAFLFAFSVGALWLRLHEQTDSSLHVIRWHYIPMIGFGVIGMWTGRKLLKW